MLPAKSVGFFFVCALAVIGAWLLWPSYIEWHLPKTPYAPGTFGDMFGALNALFTGLALVGVGITIWLQREQLKRQEEQHIAERSAAATQLQMAQEQLSMAKVQHQKELEREKRLLERELREAEPVFVFGPVEFLTRRVSVSNVGGPVTMVSTNRGPIVPDDYLSSDRIAELTLEETGEYQMVISYRRVRDNLPGQQIFIVKTDKSTIRRVDHWPSSTEG